MYTTGSTAQHSTAQHSTAQRTAQRSTAQRSAALFGPCLFELPAYKQSCRHHTQPACADMHINTQQKEAGLDVDDMLCIAKNSKH